ncbi:hypothetical protein HN873_058844 [Arachis hypogaea]
MKHPLTPQAQKIILGLEDWSSWKWQSIGKLDLYIAAAGINSKGLQKFRLERLSLFDTVFSRLISFHFFALHELWLLLRYQGHVIAVLVRENHQVVLHRQPFKDTLYLKLYEDVAEKHCEIDQLCIYYH